jgi:carbonic anhydrase
MLATAYTHSRFPYPMDDDVPRIAPLLLSALVLAPASAAAVPATAGEAAPKPIVWGYMGGGNDDEGWGELSPDFATCDLGHSQSPVGIGELTTSAMAPLRFNYQKSPASIEKKDRTLVYSFKNAGTLSDHGHLYTLEEIRIHTPAEHEVVGTLYPGELHLIHRDRKGKRLIVGVFLDYRPEGAKALDTLLDSAPAKAKTIVPLHLNPADLLPEKRGYYAYSGSLSWPPCTEGVEWRVLKESLPMSRGQMKTVGRLLGRNARLLQPLYLRHVKETVN